MTVVLYEPTKEVKKASTKEVKTTSEKKSTKSTKGAK